MTQITHAVKRVNINFNRSIDPKSWDNKRQEFKGTTPLVKEINSILLTHTTKLVKVYNNFLASGKQFSVEHC